jgi:predicted peptidase
MKKLTTLLLVACLFLSGCTKQGNENDPDPDPPGEQDIPETAPPVQKPVSFNVNGNIGGYMEALPARYDSTNKKYPLLVFIHGLGELGNGTTQLADVTVNAVPALIKNKKFPPSFTVDNKSYSFIVISPQFKAWPQPADVNAIISYAISKYRVDTTRIYVSGLSMGGGATWATGADFASRIAAIVPICGALTPNDSRAKKMADAHLPVWAFHNKDDGTVTVNNSTGFVNKINGFNANPPAKLTLWETGGHDAWTKATNPNTKENGINIYEWMLQYKRGGTN